MTQLSSPQIVGSTTTEGPGRRTLVGLAAAVLVIYVGMLATGNDLAYDAKAADIQDAYDYSQRTSQISAYGGMVFVALLLFFGAALRSAVRRRGPVWLADVTFFGFGALAATVASWVVIDSALWRAVDYGDASATRALVTIADAGFLPLMASMIAIYVGTGLAGLRTGAIPKWLAIASIAVGCTAPLGPLGFIGASLLPFWLLAAALTVRLERSA